MLNFEKDTKHLAIKNMYQIYKHIYKSNCKIFDGIFLESN